MVKAAASADPRTGLDAIVALRDLLELSERLQVDAARAAGWSWRDIADRLGVSKQAVHHKHAHRPRGR
jgi:IS30 family transposase